MTEMTALRPDVLISLDSAGVVTNAVLANAVSSEKRADWLGVRWTDTVDLEEVPHVQSMVEAAREAGGSAVGQIRQKFPSGLELPVEYAVIRIERTGGFIAVGKSVQAVAELQSRLLETQRALENDYWKLRDVETRYRLLFEASSEACMVVDTANFRVLEANPAATRAFGRALLGRDFTRQISDLDRSALLERLNKVRSEGKAPRLAVHLAQTNERWFLRASLMSGEGRHVYLIQLSPLSPEIPATDTENRDQIFDDFEKLPNSAVLLSSDGTVMRANAAFLDLAQIGGEQYARGQSLGRWLDRPGADIKVLLASIRQHGVVRRFMTSMRGNLGSETEIEVSATNGSGDASNRILLVMREISDRSSPLPSDPGSGMLAFPSTEDVRNRTLPDLVEEAVNLLETHCIRKALEIAGQNRTEAAKLLGMSRQSLYSKMNRFNEGTEPGK